MNNCLQFDYRISSPDLIDPKTLMTSTLKLEPLVMETNHISANIPIAASASSEHYSQKLRGLFKYLHVSTLSSEFYLLIP